MGSPDENESRQLKLKAYLAKRLKKSKANMELKLLEDFISEEINSSKPIKFVSYLFEEGERRLYFYYSFNYKDYASVKEEAFVIIPIRIPFGYPKVNMLDAADKYLALFYKGYNLFFKDLEAEFESYKSGNKLKLGEIQQFKWNKKKNLVDMARMIRDFLVLCFERADSKFRILFNSIRLRLRIFLN